VRRRTGFRRNRAATHGHPEETVRRRTGTAVTRGTSERGLFDSVRWRGDLWTTPREETRLCGRVARTGTRRESRRQGQEGRVRQYVNNDVRTGRRSSRTDARRRVSRSRRAAVNGQGAATSTGFFPPQAVPDDAEAWRGPRSCASARKSVGKAPRKSRAKPLERVMRSFVREGLLMKHPRAPRRERRGWAERSARP